MHFNYLEDRFQQDPARQVYASDGWWSWFGSFNSTYLDYLQAGQGNQQPELTPHDEGSMVAWRHSRGQSAQVLFMDGHVDVVQRRKARNLQQLQNRGGNLDTVNAFAWLPGERPNRTKDALYRGELQQIRQERREPAHARARREQFGGTQSDNIHPPSYPDQLNPVWRTNNRAWRKLETQVQRRGRL